MRDLTVNAVQWTRYVVEANFYFSLAILIFGSSVALSDSFTLFEFNEDIYGELGNGLRIMMVYLAFTETLIFVYCYFTKQYQHYLPAGFFLIVMIGSLAFYGQINNVEIDPNLDVFLLYMGLSPILFGAITRIQTP